MTPDASSSHVARGRGALRPLGALLKDLGLELSELSFGGARARLCGVTALAVVATVAIASALHMPDAWWAGLSSFGCLMATRRASFGRACLRIIGTAAGAGAAVVLLPLLAYDPIACGLALWFFAGLGILGFSVSSHGYAWLFVSVTFALVTLVSLQDPPAALAVGWLRVLEVGVGCTVAVLFAWVLMPGGEAVAAPFPGWSDLLGSTFPAVQYAARGGLAVASVPFIWTFWDLPSVAQMPITMTTIMAVPFALTSDPVERNRAVLERGVLRLIGCLLGGLAGLAVLALALTNFVALLALLGGGIWVCAHVQASTRGVGYVGTQGGLAFLITLVQSDGPALSILPGMDRLAGIVCGLAILLAVTSVLDLISGPTHGANARVPAVLEDA